MNSYPWIKLHRETVAKLLTFRDIQPELIAILADMKEAGLTVTPEWHGLKRFSSSFLDGNLL